MFVSMSNDVCGLFIPREIESNSAALLYSINMAAKTNKNGTLSVDFKKADKMFKFIKQNVALPDLKQDKPDPFLQKSTEALEILCNQLEKIGHKESSPDVTDGLS